MRLEKCAQRLAEIAELIEAVENRCMAADGPVTPTTKEITEAELRTIYRLAAGKGRAKLRKSRRPGKVLFRGMSCLTVDGIRILCNGAGCPADSRQRHKCQHVEVRVVEVTKEEEAGL